MSAAAKPPTVGDEMAAEFARLGVLEEAARKEQRHPRATKIEMSFGAGRAAKASKKRERAPAPAPAKTAADPALISWVDLVYRKK